MRCELSDFEWAAIRSFLPNKPHGIPKGGAGFFQMFHCTESIGSAFK